MDIEKSRLYVALFGTWKDKQIDKNTFNNVLSHCMSLPKPFTLCLDVRMFDIFGRSEELNSAINSMSVRLGEMGIHKHSQILPDYFFQYTGYPNPTILIYDIYSTKPVGYFSNMEDSEAWLDA